MSDEEEERELRFDVVVPKATFRGFDLVAVALGNPLSVLVAEALAAYMDGHPSIVTVGGRDHDVFPLCFRERVVVRIPLGRFGEMGLAHEGGWFVILVPATVAGVVERELADRLRDGRAQSLGIRSTPPGFVGSVAGFALRPDAGTQVMFRPFGLSFGVIFP